MSQTNIAIGTSDAVSYGPGGAHAATVINQTNAGGDHGGDQSNFALGSSHAASYGYGPANAETVINQSNEAGPWGHGADQSNFALGTSSAENSFPWNCGPSSGAEAHTTIDQSNSDPGYSPDHGGFDFGFMPEPQVNVAVGVSSAVSLFGPASSGVDIDQSNFGHGFDMSHFA